MRHPVLRVPADGAARRRTRLDEASAAVVTERRAWPPEAGRATTSVHRASAPEALRAVMDPALRL
ncbi:hypothetical protein [Streptomyces sp. NPDC058664]|uniref:hypothetical protein n=1 Tax=unclassified Streptomyces TaxID=2593676 RepID=UPI00365712AA